MASHKNTSSSRLFTKLATSLEKSRLVYLDAAFDVPTHDILNVFLKNNELSKDSNLLLLLENPTNAFITESAKVLDLFSDISVLTTDSLLSKIRSELCNSGAPRRKLLVIDSLNSLLITRSIREVLETLDDLLKEFELVIFSACRGIMNDIDHTKLKQISSTIISLVNDHPQKCNRAQILHKKRHKRTGFTLLTSDELFNISPSFNIEIKEERKIIAEASQSQEIPDVTFNLSLKDNEKEAREKLVLPYLK